MMDEEQLPAVERVITSMWKRYGEPLSLVEMAETAMLSKYYFSRVFRKVTGTSPGRFLAVVRLYKAKQLLVESSLSVTDIAYRVGYNSLGTFTSRFTRSVGTSPARYRALSHSGMTPFPRCADVGTRCSQAGMHGKVTAPWSEIPVRIYVGAFASPIMEGPPTSWSMLESAGAYQLHDVSEGRWFLRAAAVAVRDVDPRPQIRRPVFISACRPVTIRAGRRIEVDLHMQRTSVIDLPILLALPELDGRLLPDRRRVLA